MANASLTELINLAGLPPSSADNVEINGGDPILPLRYKVVDPGAAAIAATGLAAAELWALRTGHRQKVKVDARAAALALRSSRYLRIDGKRPPPDDEAITGFYQLKNGRWMYLHCNFFTLRERNLSVLGVPEKKDEVIKAVATWDGVELENAIYEAGGCAIFVRSEEEWLALPQAKTVAAMPLFEVINIGDAPPRPLPAAASPATEATRRAIAGAGSIHVTGHGASPRKRSIRNG